MEEQLIQILAQTQSPVEEPRRQAEQHLQSLYTNEGFPLALASIAAHDSVNSPIRQAALLSLKQYVAQTWSPEFEDTYQAPSVLSPDARRQLRQTLLEIATSDSIERRIQNAAGYVVSKIASADFPDDWPDLLSHLLGLVPKAADTSLYGALKVLLELVQEGFDDQQFFAVAGDLINVLQNVALNAQRKPMLRALAVSVFRTSFDTIEVVMEEHKAAIKSFADQTLSTWMPFFLDTIRTPLPAPPEDGQDPEVYRGLVALKVQAVRILIKIRTLFPAIIASQSTDLFSAIWDELTSMQPVYQATYVDDDKEGRMEDSDGLPYTMDFLVLEDLDFMQACIRAPPVRKELEKQLKEQANAPTNWIAEVMKLATSYAQITSEEEGMWEIDVNVFLAEETSVTANYTARIACGDLIIKLGDWLPQDTLNGLLRHTALLFQSESTWRQREAALYVLSQVLNDFEETSRPAGPQTAASFIDFAAQAQQSPDDFLRARGVLVSSHLLQAAGAGMQMHAGQMLQQVLQAIHSDTSEIVQVSCIRSLQQFILVVPPEQALPLQPSIIQSLQSWIASRDMNDMVESEDLLINLVETLRDVILLDTRICLNGEGLNLLFNVASAIPTSFQMSMIVEETFDDICEKINCLGLEAYSQLISRVLPSLVGAFDVANLTEENSLSVLAAELLSNLTRYSPGQLPANYVSTVMPKLTRLLLASDEEELLQASTNTLKYMVQHDSAQIFAWRAEDGKSGLEVLLHIIDRLLGPTLQDAAAGEVGGLASEVVEKAGAEQLGPYLVQLLGAVATRVASANRSQVIQSLIGVFARLAVTNAKDVIDFLSGQQIGDQNGLQPVMTKWLENMNLFVGWKDIRENVIALSKLYSLHDERLVHVIVKGDLVVPQSDRIMTRSKAKSNPDQYIMVPAPLKIVKLLVDELSAATAGRGELGGAAGAAAAADDDDDGTDDEEWEDEDPLEQFGVTKGELNAFGDSGLVTRQADDQTQAYLTEWFRSVGAEAGFESVFGQLTEDEREKLRAIG